MKSVFFLIFYLISLSSIFAFPGKNEDLLKQELPIIQQQNILIDELNKSITIPSNSDQDHSKLRVLPNTKNGESINSISGIILMGENLLPEGNIYLLENNKGSINSVELENVFNGEFQFKNLYAGNFFLYVIPDFDFNFPYYPKYLPTYSGNTHLWEKSIVTQLNLNLENYLISLVKYDFPFYGQKSITGKITYSEGYMGIKDIPVPIILLNEIKTPMDFRIANEFTGEYSFTNLPQGVYYIHPEIPGIKTNDYKIIVNDIQKNDEINFLIEGKFIKPENENSINQEISDHFIKIKIDGNESSPYICDLISSSGLSVFEGIFYSNEIKIQTEQFNAGIYIIKIRSFDNSFIEIKYI
jgi:hypothetical protein